tara:strand:- start:86 stop:556 length:471 start_codon:yes stop_codon:yes gene_type:complete
MKKLLLLLLILPQLLSAKTIANCQSPEGHTYFPYVGMSPKNMSNKWEKDKISGGIFQLVQNDAGEFDIQFVDASKLINSAKDDGGKVMVFSDTKNQVGIMVYYPGKVVETYTFIKNLSGENEFLMTQSKVNVVIPKASAMRGTCTFLDIASIKFKK